MWLRGRMLLDPSSPVGGGGGSSGSVAASGTPAPAPAAGGSPASAGGGGFQPPAGSRVVSDADYAARDAAYGAISSLGFKDAGEFSQYGSAFKAMRESGIDPGTFLKSFGRKDAGQPATPAGGEKQDVAAAVREALAAERRELAEREHADWVHKTPGQTRETLVKSLLGETPDEVLSKVIPALVDHHLADARIRNAYPDGHPLAGLPGRFTEADVQTITNDLKGIIDALSARDLKTIGQAANRRPTGKTAPATPAQGGNGPADEDVPVRRISSADLLAEVRAEMARQEANAAGATAG